MRGRNGNCVPHTASVTSVKTLFREAGVSNALDRCRLQTVAHMELNIKKVRKERQGFVQQGTEYVRICGGHTSRSAQGSPGRGVGRRSLMAMEERTLKKRVSR